MHWSTWAGFVLASAILGVLPGPAVMSVVGYAIGSGRRVALAAVAGMAVGNMIAMSLSLAGIGTVLAASALAFSIVKWAGALYLVTMGAIALWKARADSPGPQQADRPSVPPRTAFFNTIAVGTFHPKTIVFFVAFVPQFIQADSSYTWQATILVVTFCLVLAATDTLYAVVASRASGLLRQPRWQIWSRRVGGGAFIAAGVATAAART